jgi:hypothetical protein
MSKAYEHWIYLREGKLILHIENADYNFLKRGPEEEERVITREQVAQSFPRVLEEVDEILAGRRQLTNIF